MASAIRIESGKVDTDELAALFEEIKEAATAKGFTGTITAEIHCQDGVPRESYLIHKRRRWLVRK